MASSNRHWPSMFKSKPTHHQWQHDAINPSLVSNGSCHRTPYSTTTATTSSGLEDQRTPEPKPRWNPRPEQIRILEAIFNSGMVNPPRDEIRKIRAQLQEYGQVGDANVFYWFQNRKSRSKHKLRLQHINSKQQQQQSHKPSLTTAVPSSSSSSSDRSSPNKQQQKQQSNKTFSMGFSSPPHVVTSHDVCNLNSPTPSVNQTSFFHALPNPEVLPESAYFFPVNNPSSTNGPVASANFSTSQGFYFSELGNVVHVNNSPDLHGPCNGLFLSEIMNNNGMASRKNDRDQEMKGMKMDQQQLQLNYNSTFTTFPTTTGGVNVAVPSPMSHFQGISEAGAATMGAGGAAWSMVFINDVAFEVAPGPFSVREAFGDDAVLIHSSGHPVLTNEWGVTLHSLHHGAYYYLI